MVIVMKCAGEYLTLTLSAFCNERIENLNVLIALIVLQ